MRFKNYKTLKLIGGTNIEINTSVNVRHSRPPFVFTANFTLLDKLGGRSRTMTINGLFSVKGIHSVSSQPILRFRGTLGPTFTPVFGTTLSLEPNPAPQDSHELLVCAGGPYRRKQSGFSTMNGLGSRLVTEWSRKFTTVNIITPNLL